MLTLNHAFATSCLKYAINSPRIFYSAESPACCSMQSCFSWSQWILNTLISLFFASTIEPIASMRVYNYLTLSLDSETLSMSESISIPTSFNWFCRSAIYFPMAPAFLSSSIRTSLSPYSRLLLNKFTKDLT